MQSSLSPRTNLPSEFLNRLPIRLPVLLAFLSAGMTLIALCSGCQNKQGSENASEVIEDTIADANANPLIKERLEKARLALNSDKQEDAVLILQNLRAQPTLNPDQLTAVQDVMAAVQMELVNRADRGDSNAIRALEQLRMRRAQ